uniref:Uncharacterized protein n=1 Tax=Amolops granulosus TaxID=325557 RepID=E1AXE8_AMOGR|nr:hypothetical protein [Amolops granulosus]
MVHLEETPGYSFSSSQPSTYLSVSKREMPKKKEEMNQMKGMLKWKNDFFQLWENCSLVCLENNQKC